MAVASAFARRGREVLVIDDSLVAGGVLRALDEVGVRPWRTIFDAFARDVASGAVTLRCETTAGGFYGNDLLVVSAKPRAQAEGQARRADDAIGAEVIEARAFVIATGAHDGVLAFEGNDLPGVMSARAAGWLLSRGVLAGQKVVVVVSDGGGPFGEAYARGAARMRAPCEVLLVHGEPVRARGSSRVKGISVRVGRKSAPGDATAKAIDYTADAVLIDAPRSPSYELCEQAGATLDHRPEGFVARTLRGKLRDGVWAIGEVTGTPLDPVRIARAAEEIASQA